MYVFSPFSFHPWYGYPTRRLLAVALLSLLCQTGGSWAAVLVAYDFDDGAGGGQLGVESTIAGLSASDWTVRDGTLSFSPGTQGMSVTGRSWHDGNEFRFDVTVAPGFQLAVDGYSFDEVRSASGPSNWSLSIAGAGVASGATSDPFANQSGSVDLSGLTGAFSVILGGGGGTSSGGTWRIDNFTLLGEVSAATAVPLPAPLGLLVAGLLSIALLQRKTGFERAM